MKKIRSLLLAFVALFAFTMAIVTVNATVEVEDGTTSFFAGDFYVGVAKSSNKQAPSSTSITRNGIKLLMPPSTNKYNDAFAFSEATNDTGKTFPDEMAFGGDRTFTIDLSELSDQQIATIDFYWYTNSENKVVTVGSSAVSVTTDANNINKVLKTSSIDNFTSSDGPTITGNSNVVFLQIDVHIKSLKVSAADAITAIGTVSYTQECLNKINVAKAAVDACDDRTAISNIATYDAALEAFEQAKDAAVADFVDSVNALVMVTADSYPTIVALKAKYKVLLAAEREVSQVVEGKERLDNAEEQLYYEAYDSLNTTLNFNHLEEKTYDSNEILAESIFKVYASETSTVVVDSSSGVKRLKLGGAQVPAGSEIKDGNTVIGYTSSNTKTIEFDVMDSGTLKVKVQSSSSTGDPRKLNLYMNTISEGTFLHEFVAPTSNPAVQEYKITAAGHYILGSPASGVNITELAFEKDPEVEASTDFYLDHGYNEAGTELIRVVMVAKNVGTAEVEVMENYINTGKIRINITNANNNSLILNDTSHFILAKNIVTGSGATYSFTDSEDGLIVCEEAENTLYGICVIAVSNDGADLLEQYQGW
ncbi:MAG: hypothetical protein NC310_02790 [Roseburia sp.]|nr:hypothetical protein [Anaeroplasma bactoclasticum]MCM1195984.1 hypothetical protein [Roseburia sp.]